MMVLATFLTAPSFDPGPHAFFAVGKNAVGDADVNVVFVGVVKGFFSFGSGLMKNQPCLAARGSKSQGSALLFAGILGNREMALAPVFAYENSRRSQNALARALAARGRSPSTDRTFLRDNVFQGRLCEIFSFGIPG